MRRGGVLARANNRKRGNLVSSTSKALAHFTRHIVFGSANKLPACDRHHHAIHSTARRAEERRDGPFLLGTTEPLAAEAFAGWVRDSVPANIATDATVEVTATGQSFLGGDDRGITHEAVVTLRKARATLGIRWQQGPGKPAGDGAVVEFVPAAAVP